MFDLMDTANDVSNTLDSTPVGHSLTFTIPRNPNRLGLLFYAGDVATVLVRPSDMPAGVGVNVFANDRPHLIHKFFHGASVEKEWTVIHSAADVSAYTEIIRAVPKA